MFFWKILWIFPQRTKHTNFFAGKNTGAERKDVFGWKAPWLSRKRQKERTIMSNSNNNQINVPQAREAMDRFKMQAAQEVGVNLTNGYNGHLTSREAGSVGGQMVKKMIESYEKNL
jgi:small acid-soluble spore protein D (minor alpha/beta-type SASP)